MTVTTGASTTGAPTTGASTTGAVQIPVRLDFDSRAAAFSRAMSHLDTAATKELDRVGFDPRLRELVRIRASQLNGCAYCIDMHTKDARAIGETEQRIYALPAWAETPYFTPRERAALAFTESVTLLARDHVPARAYESVAAEFSADEVAALVSLIVTINAWNAIAVSTRAWVPGSYQP
jgi:AhpD family alkylhydroperoxidase